ncbi:hypothetical protein AcV7_005393 [Taiwanofungus camphoratus]|nr:hypothetical protein AcV7_005393 [Antrodia cinnamomea]
MSTSLRALGIEPSTMPGHTRRRLSDLDDTNDQDGERTRDTKRIKLSDGEKKHEVKERERKKRRKKKRKLSVVQLSESVTDASNLPDAEAPRRSIVASGSGSGSPSHSVVPDGVRSPSAETSTFYQLHNAGHSLSRQSSEGPSSVTAGTCSPEAKSPQPSTLEILKKRSETVPAHEGQIRSLSPPVSSIPAPELAELTTRLTTKEQLLERHTTLMGAFQQSLTCQICLDLMHKPYALAPCGHTACHACLVQWFSAPPADIPPAEVPPPWLRRKTCPHCRATVKERPVEVWAVKDMVSTLVKSGLAHPSLDSPAPDPAPDTASEDPWDGIFRKLNRGMGAEHHHPMIFPDPPHPAMLHQVLGLHDAEDGSIYRCIDCGHELWDGVCSSCGRVYPGHAHAPHAHLDPSGDGEGWDDEYWDGEEFDEWDAAMGPGGHLGGFLWGAPLVPPQGWGMFGGDTDVESVSGESAGGDTEVDDGPQPPQPRVVSIHPDEHEEEEDNSDDDGEGYESSFIDDEDDHGVPHPFGRGRSSRSRMIDLTSDADDDDAHDGNTHVGSRRMITRGGTQRSRRRRSNAAPIVISSADDMTDESEPRRLMRVRHASQRGRRPMMIASDGEEDIVNLNEENEDENMGGDLDLAAEVAAREREMYGDDGSVQRRSASYVHPYDDEGGFDEGSDEDDDSNRSDM